MWLLPKHVFYLSVYAATKTLLKHINFYFYFIFPFLLTSCSTCCVCTYKLYRWSLVAIYLSWHQFICSRRHLEAQQRPPADIRGITREVWKHVAVYGNIFTSTRVQTCSVTPALLGSVRECSHARSLTEQNTERFVFPTCTDVFKLGLNLSSDEDSRRHPPWRSTRRAGLRFYALTLQGLCKSYQNTTAERHTDATQSGFVIWGSMILRKIQAGTSRAWLSRVSLWVNFNFRVVTQAYIRTYTLVIMATGL